MTHDEEHHVAAQKTLGFMTERELASRWSVSTRTLQRWRASGQGPAHVRFLGLVRYPIADVLAFEVDRRSGGAGS